MMQWRIPAVMLFALLVSPAFAQTPPRRGAGPDAMPAPTESRIHVMSATLGRSEINKVCDALKTVARQCDGLSRCRFTVSDTLCEVPNTPDPLIAVLRVEYRCNPQDQVRSVAVERPLDATIICRRKVPLP